MERAQRGGEEDVLKNKEVEEEIIRGWRRRRNMEGWMEEEREREE